jgi:hypothetical protein
VNIKKGLIYLIIFYLTQFKKIRTFILFSTDVPKLNQNFLAGDLSA